MKKFALASALLFTTASFAKTYDLSRRFGVGGGGGWTIPILGNKFDKSANEDFVYNFHARYNITDAKALIFTYSRHQWENTNINAKVYDIMYLVRTQPVNRFTPIFGIGAGTAELGNYQPNNTKISARARGGFEYAITEDLFADAVVDYQYINSMPGSNHNRNMPGGEIHALAPQLNLTLFFGHDKEKGEDKAKAAAPAAVAAMDPNQHDSDGDGIVDAKDKCPTTQAGMQVNAYGCVDQEKAHIEVKVLFPSGSSTLSPGSTHDVEALANFLNEHPETKAEIQGHTDNTGSPARNRRLSQARADAVRLHLINDLHIAPQRITATGYGSDQPVSDNSTPEGRADNRRVMAVISQ